MVNSIIDAIGRALNEEFGDDYEIYGEEIKQGLKEPCFFIGIMSASVTPYPGKRYLKSNELCIQYFPKDSAVNSECGDVAERMEQCLEYITLDDGRLRGTDISHEMHEGVMSFFVSYRTFVVRTEKEEQMETMLSDTLIKEVD